MCVTFKLDKSEISYRSGSGIIRISLTNTSNFHPLDVVGHGIPNTYLYYTKRERCTVVVTEAVFSDDLNRYELRWLFTA